MPGMGMQRSSIFVAGLLFYCTLGKPTKGGSKACSHTGFYSKTVVPLCDKHFPDDKSKNPWLVQFYHGRVKKCIDQKQIIEELASETKDVKVGAVDCEQNWDFCKKNYVAEAPVTKLLFQGKEREFSGAVTKSSLELFIENSLQRFKAINEAMKCTVKGVFKDRLKDTALPLCTETLPPDAEELPWLVSFYESGERNRDKTQRNVMNKLATLYGNLPPGKIDASTKKPKKLRVGAVDCSEQKGCDKFAVVTFPTVRFYRHGADPVDFDDSFAREDIQNWAEEQLKLIPKRKEVEALATDVPEGDKPADVPEGDDNPADSEL